MALAVDCRTGKGLNGFVPLLKNRLGDKLEQYRSKGMVGKPLRVMVVGIPNVGKSSFINRMAGGSKAKVEDRPGVTRGNQWFRIDKQLEILDTPGVLWPKFDDKRTALNLAFTGAIKDQILDIESLASLFMELMSERYGENLKARYKISCNNQEPGYEILERAGKARGFLISGGEVNTERMAKALLDDFRGGLLGKISLENVDEAEREPLEKIQFRGMISE